MADQYRTASGHLLGKPSVSQLESEACLLCVFAALTDDITLLVLQPTSSPSRRLRCLQAFWWDGSSIPAQADVSIPEARQRKHGC